MRCDVGEGTERLENELCLLALVIIHQFAKVVELSHVKIDYHFIKSTKAFTAGVYMLR